MCSLPSSVVRELEANMQPAVSHPATAAVSQVAAFEKQYSTSSQQSEDELDTQAPLEPVDADSSLAASQWSTVEQDLSHFSTNKSSGRSSLWTSAQPLLTSLAPAAFILVAFSWLIRRLRRRTHKQQQPPPNDLLNEPEPTLSIYASEFSLEPSAASPRQAHLGGVRCVVAEHIAVQGAVVGCGVPAVWSQCPQAHEHPAIIRKLLAVGISISGQGTTQPCNYPVIGDNIRNPVGRYRAAGGGSSGAAVAVARGEADLALGTDCLGSVRMPAACLGLYGFVCTPGAAGAFSPDSAPTSSRTTDAGDASDSHHSNGADPPARRSSSGGGSSSSSIENIGLICTDLGLMCQVASFLGLPGTANLRHELTQVVVAEDLFQLCEPELAPGILAVKRAVLAWAGNEQAGSVQLLQFILANTSSWRDFSKPQGSKTGHNSSQPELPDVLAALTRAAQILYHKDLSSRYQELLQGVPESDLGPDVAQALAEGASVTEQELDAARAVQKEVQDVMKAAVRRDVVVVVPCIPAAPPRLDCPQDVCQTWLQRCHAFSALTTLAGCPSVVLPTGALPNGGPLGLALFGQTRTDQRLLAVADKLMPHIQVELEKLRQQAGAPKAGAATAGAGVPSNTTQDKGPQVDPKRVARAEKAKARGNDAYKAGRYMEAISAYSEAIKQNPANPVYISNRAMAYLKVFSFEAAEKDCNRVLSFDYLQPADQVKALLRRGTARMHKGDLRGARSDFREVLSAEPNNRQAQEELKAVRQQELDLEDTRRQHALAAAANQSSALPNFNSWGTGAELPILDVPNSRTLQQGPGGAGFTSSLPGINQGSIPHPEEYFPGIGGGNSLNADQLESMLRSGGMSVVLGENGEPVCGPSGEPVIVGPDGQELAIQSSGEITPYTPRDAGL